MRLCLECGKRFECVLECPRCHHSAATLDGFLTFAPALTMDSKGFKKEYFEQLACLEADNFWFKARNHLIVWALKRYFSSAVNFLEIGCGTGSVLSGIQQAVPDLALSGSEIFIEGLRFASRRLKKVELFQIDARRIPFESEFDVIGAFDVLEHIPEDEQVLQSMYQAVAFGGGVIVSVPQHRFLWSRQDEYACHVRRYSRVELVTKMRRTGFRIEKAFSFMSLLLPLMMVSRWKKSILSAGDDPMSELKIGSLTNRILEMMMKMEFTCIAGGISLPFGGSLMIVARKG